MSKKDIAASLQAFDIPRSASYVQRKANAIGKGFTSTQARGHAGKGILSISDTKLALKSISDPKLKSRNWLIIGTYKAELKGDKDVVELYKQAKKSGFSKAPNANDEQAPFAKLVNTLRDTIDRETGKKRGRKFTRRKDEGEISNPFRVPSGSRRTKSEQLTMDDNLVQVD